MLLKLLIYQGNLQKVADVFLLDFWREGPLQFARLRNRTLPIELFSKLEWQETARGCGHPPRRCRLCTICGVKAPRLEVNMSAWRTMVVQMWIISLMLPASSLDTFFT